jgi:hypothetical protein
MGKWVRRIVVALIAAFALLYCGDWAVYRLRGAPQGTVKVSRYLTIPLKGNKQEFDNLGTSDAPCSVSIFSQDGMPACWKLRRNPTQNTTI